MHHSSQRVQIGPWALRYATVVSVLFNGGVIDFENGGVLVGVIANGQSRCAQIQQHRWAAVLQKDVVR